MAEALVVGAAVTAVKTGIDIAKNVKDAKDSASDTKDSLDTAKDTLKDAIKTGGKPPKPKNHEAKESDDDSDGLRDIEDEAGDGLSMNWGKKGTGSNTSILAVGDILASVDTESKKLDDHKGAYLKSDDEDYYLVMCNDGVLRLYVSKHWAVKNCRWQSCEGTPKYEGEKVEGPFKATLLEDNNFVIYDKDDNKIWSNNAGGSRKVDENYSTVANFSFLRLENTGNLVFYQFTPHWETHT